MNRESLAKFVFGFSGVLCYIKLAKNAGFSECLFLCCLKIAKKPKQSLCSFCVLNKKVTFVHCGVRPVFVTRKGEQKNISSHHVTFLVIKSNDVGLSHEFGPRKRNF